MKGKESEQYAKIISGFFFPLFFFLLCNYLHESKIQTQPEDCY